MTLQSSSVEVKPVVVFAVGNPSRGDDALGPELLARFADYLEAQGRAGHFELIEDFQLQIEHALDLEGRRLALFIDAGHGTPAPFSLDRTQPAPLIGHSTHALEPAAVLDVFHRTLGQSAPPAFTLCVRGEAFELGEGLSPLAQDHLQAAFALLCRLAEAPELAEWDAVAARR